jgi:hypothetical protein
METTLEKQPQPAQSRFKFWLTWVGWNALGYLILGLINLSLSLASSGGLLSAVQNMVLVRQLVILAALLLPAAAIGWTQQRALRSYIHEHFLWFLATMLAFAMISMMSGGTYYDTINQRLSTMGFSGYEDRQVEQGILAFLSIIGSGILLGLFQWVVLRLEVRRAGWWLAISTAAYAVFGLVSMEVFQAISTYLMANPTALTQESIPYVSAGLNYVLYLIFPILTGIGLAFLLFPVRRQVTAQSVAEDAGAPAVAAARVTAGGEDNYRKRLLIRLTLATALAILLNGLLDVLGVVSALTGWIAPLIKNTEITSALPVVILGILLGLMVGWAQVWALGPSYPRRWVWVIAAVVAFFFQGLNSMIPVDVLNNFAQQGLMSYPTLWLEFIRQVAFLVGFWLILGLIQAAALWQWAGRRSWAWFLVIPVIEAAMLLARLVFGYPLENGGLALVIGAALIFFLRSGWNEELILTPRTETPPDPAELDLAAEIVQNRLSQALHIHSQVTVEEGMLVASFNSKKDLDASRGLALKPGKLAIFDASSGLPEGAALPQDALVLVTESDVLSASMPGEPEDAVRLLLSDDANHKLGGYLESHPNTSLGVAVDGTVLTTLPAPALNEAGLDVTGIPEEEAHELVGILDNDSLPFTLEVVEGEEEAESGEASEAAA